MSTLDLYEPGFPHGSEAGWRRGCRGKRECTYFDDEHWFTCLEAHQYRAGDYQTALRPIDEPVARPAKVIPAKPTKSQRETFTEPIATSEAPKATSRDTERPIQDIGSDDVTVSFKRRGRPKLAGPDDPTFPHGTNSGYTRGCRDNCPGNPIAGITCREAKRLDQQERRATRRAIAQPPTASAEASPAPAPEGDVPADDTATSAEAPDSGQEAVPGRTAPWPDQAAALEELEQADPDHMEISRLRDDLALAEQAGRELQVQVNRLSGDLDAAASDVVRLAGINASLAKTVNAYAADLVVANGLVRTQGQRLLALGSHPQGHDDPPITLVDEVAPSGDRSLTITIHVGA